MSFLLPRRLPLSLCAALLLGPLASLLPNTARAQAVDQLVNSGSVAVQYKLAGSATFLTLSPGASLAVSDLYDLQNQTPAQAQLTVQRLINGGWLTGMVIKMYPGSQGTFSPQGALCNIGQWTVTTYEYSSQYIGNLYSRVILVGLLGSAPHGGNAPITVPPVINVWGYESYAGGSRLEITTLDYLRTGGQVRLSGSSDPNCPTNAYTVSAQGQYINWNSSGTVTTSTFPCARATSAPGLPLAGAAALIAGMLLLLGAGRRRESVARA